LVGISIPPEGSSGETLARICAAVDWYHWLGVDWPENRYLLISLSGDADIKDHQTGTVHGWRCRYDLQTGKFDVPPLFSNDNAKAVVPMR
jgi:hypothetical protein